MPWSDPHATRATVAAKHRDHTRARRPRVACALLGRKPDGAADGEAVGAALARRRLRGQRDLGPRQLLRGAPHDTEVRQGARGSLAPDVGSALAQSGRRENWVGDDDLVFAAEAGGHLDGSALRRAPGVAGLRALRFHDLRHTFGTRIIARADIRRVQAWMGDAEVQTTRRHLHYYTPRQSIRECRPGDIREVSICRARDSVAA
jgi:hypothetical protein